MSESESGEKYHCEKCGIDGEYNEDCSLCLMIEDIEENRAAYERMGELP